MRLALRLARRGYGLTSPNPMVGAVLFKGGKIIGRGWHRGAGLPHAEIEAIRDALRHGQNPRDATLYVTLEPCSTFGRTPPCTRAIVECGLKRVVIGTVDPHPAHCGRAVRMLQRAGIAVTSGVLGDECAQLNEPFNHWIVHRTPFVTVKAAMTIDGKIATPIGESKWITGPVSRAFAMQMRRGTDAVLVGINTVLADDPALTVRTGAKGRAPACPRQPRRIVLDSLARIPLTARLLRDQFAPLTTVVVTERAPRKRVIELASHVNVLVAPLANERHPPQPPRIDLHWVLKQLGAQEVTSLLVEGGGEVNASFLLGGIADRIAFFYSPTVLGGRDAIKAVAGEGASGWADAVRLRDLQWRRLGQDLLLIAKLK